MPRRFQIRASLSPELFSSCGFPEGDALSCVAMMVIDVIFHEWFRHYMPSVQPISYVDDWQLLLCNPDLMQSAYQTLDLLVQELDLLLDRRKSHVWAVHFEGRKKLRNQGYALSACCKSLGAQIQVTKQHTNGVQMERVQSLSCLWPRLRLSSCGYSLKVRAIKTAAWPRGLHAIAATTISLATFQSLRAGAMKGCVRTILVAMRICTLALWKILWLIHSFGAFFKRFASSKIAGSQTWCRKHWQEWHMTPSQCTTALQQLWWSASKAWGGMLMNRVHW